jgi:splicing factor 4
MEASGDKAAAARAKALQPNTLGADNIGHKLMQKMGWKEGQGLGGSNQGAAAPVAAQGTADGLGLGAAPSGAVEEGDDEFTRYRKRSESLGTHVCWGFECSGASPGRWGRRGSWLD